jgi:hypothetical protein
LVNDGDKDPESKLVGQTEHNFELTQSLRGAMDGSLNIHGVHMGEDEDDEIERSLQKSKEEKGKHTHFDPQIVITDLSLVFDRARSSSKAKLRARKE